MNSENQQPQISLSDIPMQESEICIIKDEEKKAVPISESQQTDDNVGLSVTDMRILSSHQAMIKQVRFSN